jgi:hypothetical protein
MVVRLVAAASVWVAITLASGALASGSEPVIVSERNGEIVLHVAPHHDDPSTLPVTTFLVAVPAGVAVRVERTGGESHSRPMREDELRRFEPTDDPLGGDPLPRGIYPEAPVLASKPYVYRNTHVVAVSCYFRQLDSETKTALDWTGYQVAVRYPPARRTQSANAVDPLLANRVVNRDVFPIPQKSVGTRPSRSAVRAGFQAGVDPHFSLSPSGNWIKIEVNRRGLYEVTYEDLRTYNVDNPATFRLFTGSGFAQKRDLSDPEGTWKIGNWMDETAIYVEGGGDGTFDAGDRILFYGLGAEDWMDYYDSSAPDTVYHTHRRATTNYYYLTWNGNFSGNPLRMDPVAAAPGGGPDRTTHRERIYREKNLVDDYDYGGDFWLWMQLIDKTLDDPTTAILETIDVNDLVTSVDQEFRTVALAPYDFDVYVIVDPDTIYLNEGHHAEYQVWGTAGGRTIGHHIWDAEASYFERDRRYEDGKPVRLTGSFLTEGSNQFRLRLPKDLNRMDWMYFAWFSTAFERRTRARVGRLSFSSPDTTGSVNFAATGLPETGALYVFDVTERFDVDRLTGFEIIDDGGTRRVRFSSSFAGGRRHFWVTSDQGLDRPASIRKLDPVVDLRDAVSGPNMLIVTTRALRNTAGQLASHRRNHLPHFGSGVVNVVTVEEIYDNFSGGQPDPMAIRNYIKFLYDNFEDSGNPSLAYVVLFGDATADFKNHANPLVDGVPAFVYIPPREVDKYAFATDEWYNQMDASDQEPGNGVGDLAIGRLPAGSSSEAGILVEKIIGYETAAPLGTWRNQVVLVADDPGTGPYCEPDFTRQSETMACCKIPGYIDVHKVYLADFPAVSGLKPGSNRALMDLWKNGATVINYIGHGGSQVMADEHVFVAANVAELDNGLKLPVLMAFSCTVGDYANPIDKSLSEQLLFKQGGGAIGTITASELSYKTSNTPLDFAVFDEMLPKQQGGGIPLGESLMAAKLNVMVQIGLGSAASGRENNNWKYNLLGDPALRVLVPRNEIRLIPDTPDTLTAGIRKSIRGGVYKGGVLDTKFDGTVTVRVHEPDRRGEATTGACYVWYHLPGGTVYRGETLVTGGEFELNFRVPRYARTGSFAYFTAYADNGREDASAAIGDRLDLVPPTLADTTRLKPVDGPPRVAFRFKSGLKVVKPGETLQAIVRDGDGINILGTTGEGRLSLLIDDSLVPTDVTKDFNFDAGGTDTSGVLEPPLPEQSGQIGNHRVILRVSDSFSQMTLDTLNFVVTDPLDYFAEVLLNYPNPFATSTQFLIRLSDRASIKLDIFTVSGKRIRQFKEVRDSGDQWLFWDGRDTAGDEIANGTYLYVTTVDFEDLDRPPLVMRGKLTKIQ